MRGVPPAHDVTCRPVTLVSERGTSSVANASGGARNDEKRQSSAFPRAPAHGSEYITFPSPSRMAMRMPFDGTRIAVENARSSRTESISLRHVALIARGASSP